MKIEDIKTEHKERDFEICQAYLEGDKAEIISSRVGLSISRVYQILYDNRSCIKVDNDWEKAKRIHWLQTIIKSKTSSRKDKADLIEQLRKEIEGDRPSVQINDEKHTHITYRWEGRNDKVQPQDYQLESLDHPARYKIIVRGRRGGKTEEEIQGAIKDTVTDPGLHWITAPSYRQVKSIIWTRLKSILRVDKDWIFNEQELYAENPYIRADDGRATRLELKGCDKEDSLVGVGLKSVRMDEAALTKANVWPNIIRPMLADYQASAYFYTTPRGRNWLYDLYMKGCDPNEKDWMSWRQPTVINKYIHPDEIAQMKKDMPGSLFRQEVLAEFLDDDTGVFKGVNRCITGVLKPPVLGRYYVIGIDLALTHDFTVLNVLDSVTRETVAHYRFHDVSWLKQKLEIQRVAHLYNNALCILDATKPSYGSPILEDLRAAGVSAEGFEITSRSKPDLINLLSMTIEQRLITIPPELEVLINELKDYEYTITTAGNIQYSAPSGKFDDCVIALALSVFGIRHMLKEAQVVISDEEPYIQNRQGRGEIVNPIEESGVQTGY